MITKYMTEIAVKFNPFSPRARSARLFLSYLPPTVRADGTAISTTLLPRTSTEPASLLVKFKDGKEMNLNCEEIGIKGLIEEVDRHSRALHKQANLNE
ncbi:mitochondrial ribosomal protein L44 (39S ribosomal protein L53/MRP-L5) [Zalerion maritima]|uniref:Large ribosomal subunit protein mL53 n=1 Tax=Zalerion maritima TaxID=339359 RepID=A0AAD5WW31_9PEZI|nr:mitochondrial ribosomal protein L44 (39S ribosomal protein L53/MRP-L5) [Zalerion maritima]